MRLLIASLTALAVFAVAAPSSAQDTPPTPAPTAKPKQGTAAYCNTLKSATSRSACLKRVQAQSGSHKTPHKPAKKTEPTQPKPDTSAEGPAPAPTPSPKSSQSTVTVPPLPQKTI